MPTRKKRKPQNSLCSPARGPKFSKKLSMAARRSFSVEEEARQALRAFSTPTSKQQDPDSPNASLNNKEVDVGTSSGPILRLRRLARTGLICWEWALRGVPLWEEDEIPSRGFFFNSDLLVTNVRCPKAYILFILCEAPLNFIFHVPTTKSYAIWPF